MDITKDNYSYLHQLLHTVEEHPYKEIRNRIGASMSHYPVDDKHCKFCPTCGVLLLPSYSCKVSIRSLGKDKMMIRWKCKVCNGYSWEEKEKDKWVKQEVIAGGGRKKGKKKKTLTHLLQQKMDTQHYTLSDIGIFK